MIKIPFKLNKNYSSPLITVIIDNKEFTFLFDTGAYYNTFSKKGISKWEGGFELYKEALEKYKDPLVFDLLVDYIFINGNKFEEVPFKYQENESEFDGIIGYNFFSGYKNFVIDFKNKEFRTDEKSISNESLPLIIGGQNEMNTVWGMLHTIVKIDNKEVPVLIDTGFDSIEKMMLIAESMDAKKVGNDEYPIFNVNLKILDLIDENISARKVILGGGTFGWGEVARSIVRDVNIIGCSIFYEHVLQFDLHKKLFRII